MEKVAMYLIKYIIKKNNTKIIEKGKKVYIYNPGYTVTTPSQMAFTIIPVIVNKAVMNSEGCLMYEVYDAYRVDKGEKKEKYWIAGDDVMTTIYE
jgi:hypothetical protein